MTFQIIYFSIYFNKLNLKYRGVKLNPKEDRMILKKLVEGIRKYSGQGSKVNRPESLDEILLEFTRPWSPDSDLKMDKSALQN